MKMRYAGLTLVFIWFLAGGIGHFALTDTFMRIVPPYIPWPRAAVYISGVAELLGAAALLSPRTRSLAGMFLIVLTLCVTPANVYMWVHPELFPAISPLLLTLRLFVQVLLIACIWWSTRPAARR